MRYPLSSAERNSVRHEMGICTKQRTIELCFAIRRHKRKPKQILSAVACAFLVKAEKSLRYLAFLFIYFFFLTEYYSSATRSKDKDLEAAVEPVSGDQFKDQSLQCVVGAGRVQSEHVKAPAVDILRGRPK